MKRAMELGWHDVSDIRWDVDLVNLRNTAEGSRLLETIEKAQAAQ